MTGAGRLAAVDAACNEYETEIKRTRLHGGDPAYRFYAAVRKAVGGELSTEEFSAVNAACDEYKERIKKKELHAGIAAREFYISVRTAVGGEIVP